MPLLMAGIAALLLAGRGRRRPAAYLLALLGLAGASAAGVAIF